MDYNTLDRQASTLENNALTAESAASLLPAKLREAVALRFQNSPIVAQRDTALKTFMDEPSKTREQLAGMVQGGTILSPEQQQVIASGNRSNATIPLLSANDMLARETGGIEGLIQAGVGAYNAEVKAKQGKAELARKAADTAFDRFIKNAELKIKQQEANAKYGTGTAPNATTMAYVEQLMNGTIKNFTAIPTEERGKVVSLLSSKGVNVNELQKQVGGKTTAGLLSTIIGSYLGGKNISNQPELAKGVFGNLYNLVGNLAPKTKAYNNLREGTIAGLKSLTGDTGILTDQDAARLVNLLPATTDNPKLALGNIKNIDSLVYQKFGISVTGPITVVDKKNGQVGTIDGMFEYDPDKYDIISQ